LAGMESADRRIQKPRLTESRIRICVEAGSALHPELAFGNHAIQQRRSTVGQFDDQVICLRYHPGMDPSWLRVLITSEIQGVVVESCGLGGVSYQERPLLPWITEATTAGKVVVFTSQCLKGGVDFSRYECQQHMQAAGAVSAGDMTTDAAIVKLMHLLGRYPGNPSRVRKLFPAAAALPR